MIDLFFSEASFSSCQSSGTTASLLAETCRSVARIQELVGSRPHISAHQPPSMWVDQSGANVYQALSIMSQSCKELSTLTLQYLTSINTVPFTEIISEDYRLSNEVVWEYETGCEEALSCIFLKSQMLSVNSRDPYQERKIRFELQGIDNEGDISSEEITIGNISQLPHADDAAAFFINESYEKLTTENCIEKIGLVYPFLRFTESAKHQISNFNEGEVRAIFSRLKDLNSTARTWRQLKLSFPNWQCNVTRESKSIMDNPSERAKRVFKSCSGTDEVYELHAKIGGNRIHLLVIHEEKILEIGYIGPHL